VDPPFIQFQEDVPVPPVEAQQSALRNGWRVWMNQILSQTSGSTLRPAADFLDRDMIDMVKT